MTPAADDFAAIARRLAELEAERRAALADEDSAEEPAPMLEDLMAAVVSA